MFFCIPIICGPVPHTKPDREQGPRLCPNCHNQTVHAYKRRTWFELYWIPLIPFKVKHLLVCTTCQWTALNPSTTDDGTKANAAGSDQYAQQQQRQQANSNYPPPPGRGYDVGYQTQPQGAKV